MKKKDVKVVVLGKPSIKTLSKDQMDILCKILLDEYYKQKKEQQSK